jgi:hypothetical protein
MGRAARAPTICQQGLQTVPQLFIVYGIDERICLHREVLNLEFIVRSHFGCVRPHYERAVETQTSNARCSQMSGQVRSAEGGTLECHLKLSRHNSDERIW